MAPRPVGRSDSKNHGEHSEPMGFLSRIFKSAQPANLMRLPAGSFTLDREGRIVELAQMLGGDSGGATSLAAARELLDRAEAWRGGVAQAG